jgi:hypothetical protein
VAIYVQEHKISGAQRFEVVIIRVRAEHQWPDGRVTPEHEAYPGPASWGVLGFTYFNCAAAEAQVAKLQAVTA